MFLCFCYTLTPPHTDSGKKSCSLIYLSETKTRLHVYVDTFRVVSLFAVVLRFSVFSHVLMFYHMLLSEQSVLAFCSTSEQSLFKHLHIKLDIYNRYELEAEAVHLITAHSTVVNNWTSVFRFLAAVFLHKIQRHFSRLNIYLHLNLKPQI